MKMRRSERVAALASFFLAISLVLGSATYARAQRPKSLPPNWKSLPMPEQIRLIMQFYDPVEDKLVGNIDEEEIRTLAAKAISQIDFTTTKLEYKLLDPLHWAADPKLSPEQQEQFQKALLARFDDWQGKPYQEIKLKCMLMRRLHLPKQLRVREGRRWVRSGGSLESVPENDLPEFRDWFIESDAEHISGSFQVRWEGEVLPPKTGSYKFSVSPINVNSASGQYPLKITMGVRLADDAVLSADDKNWNSMSRAVAMTAGRPALIRVDLAVEARTLPNHAVHALLYWEGPEGKREIVPAQALRLPGGAGQGLKATYAWTDNGLEKSLTRTDPAVDFAWTATPISLFQDTQPLEQMNEAFWERTTSKDYMDWCQNPGGKRRLHPFFQDPDAMAASFSSERRNAFLDQLLTVHEPLLDSVTAKQAVLFYGAFRIGAPEKAIAAFGDWAMRHANLECDLPRPGVTEPGDAGFDADARLQLCRMAIFVTRELPQHAAVLEKQFLKLPDGRCSLPVAYTLGYSYVARGKLGEWTTFLEKTLQRSDLTGDPRINWLLARSFAEEIRLGQPEIEHYQIFYARPLDGRRFIDQAITEAQLPDAKVRLAKELAGRLASAGDLEGARKAIDEAVVFASDRAQEASLADWQAQLDGLKAAAKSAAANAPKVAHQAYLDSLQKRRAQAVKRQDQQAVKRYDALLESARKSQ